MSFGKELRDLSSEAVQNGALLRDGMNVWNPIKEALKEFAKETGERGCNVFFQNISDQVISQLGQLATADEIEFINWNSPSDSGHPGKPFEQIGVITWDSSWYFSKYPLKVSRYSLIVSDKNGIKVKMIDAGVNATLSMF